MTNAKVHDLRELIDKQDWNTINTHQATWSTPKIVGIMQELPQAEKVILFRLLEKDRAIEVFERLDIAEQTDLVRAMTDPDAVRLLEGLDADLRTHIFDELPAKVTKRLLAALSPDARQAVNTLLSQRSKVRQLRYNSGHGQTTAIYTNGRRTRGAGRSDQPCTGTRGAPARHRHPPAAFGTDARTSGISRHGDEQHDLRLAQTLA